MTTTTKNLSQSSTTGLGGKLAQFAYFVAATVLMIELREKLQTQTSGAKSDAALTYGL